MRRPAAFIIKGVTKLAARLLVLLAVLLMPLGMATAAAPTEHAQAMAGMPMEHCPDQTPQHDMKGGLAACTMACSAALPAADLARSELEPLALVAVMPAPIVSLDGIEPETATPPPRLS
jgi:hypothetical protein